jgi:hypothetical protein
MHEICDLKRYIACAVDARAGEVQFMCARSGRRIGRP